MILAEFFDKPDVPTISIFYLPTPVLQFLPPGKISLEVFADQTDLFFATN